MPPVRAPFAAAARGFRAFVWLAPTLAALVGAFYGPWLLALELARTVFGWPGDMVDALAGFLSLAVTPLVNAATLELAAGRTRGERRTIAAALVRGASAYRRLFAAYLTLSLIATFFAALGLVPGGLWMLVTGATSPYVLVPFAAATLLWGMPRYALLEALVVTRGLESWQARMRSVELTRGRRLSLALAGLASFTPAVAIEGGASVAVMPPEAPKILVVLIAVGLGLAAQLLYLCPVVLFYEALAAVPVEAPLAKVSTSTT
jgi:hypothetical protein